ncbi:MAG: hypothetical protein R2991_09895 [Thermoanaerobaculia bacterium]
MIAFATFFLGLVLGVQTVAVMTSEDVAQVELRLDEHSLVVLDRPPWRAPVDLGDTLEPRMLTAIARDADGLEVARAEQALNLPRPPAELEILLEPGTGGRGAVARVSWDSIVSAAWPAVTAAFDGVEIPVADPRRIPLPDHDPAQLHFLRVDAVFGEHISTFAERVLGGTYADRLSTELTAVPVRLTGRRDLPAVEDLGGWVRIRGAEAPVLAVDEGPADLIVVRDVSAQSGLDSFARSSRNASLRYVARLKTDQRVRFLSPFARPVPHPGYSMSLFEPTESLTAQDGGLYWLLTRVRPKHTADEGQRLADAVGAAGLTAAGGSRPRAILLLLGPDPEDRSTLEAGAVRRYLRSLRVPLVVWTVGGEATTPWGDAERIDSLASLERAVKSLRRDLERQRILWVEGVHLPRSIELTDRALGTSSPRPETVRFLPVFLLLLLPQAPDGPAPDGPVAPIGSRSAFDLSGAEETLRVEAGVRLRREPDDTSPPLATIEATADLPVLDRLPGWTRVRLGAWVGWVPADGREPEETRDRSVSLTRVPPAADRQPIPDPELLARALEHLSDPSSPARLGPFALYTDSRRTRLVERLVRLGDELVDTYARRFGLTVGPVRGAIVLFASEKDYRDYLTAAVEPAVSFARGHARSGVAAFFVGEEDELQLPSILVHEATHLIDHETLGRDLPPWLEEGLASDLSSSRITADGRIDTGSWGGSTSLAAAGGRLWMRQSGAQASRRQLLESWRRGRLLPLVDLLRMSWTDFVSDDGRVLHYHQATAFVRYLLDGDDGLAPGFRSYLAALAGGSDPLDPGLLEASLDRSTAELERGLDLWLGRQELLGDGR